MNDQDMVEGEAMLRGLTPANENPWYVLMTLYGEQEGEEVDWELHERNRRAWNAWACQGMGEENRRTWDVVDQPEWFGWEIEAGKIQADHEAAMMARNGSNFSYPGFPEPADRIQMNNLVFDNAVFAGGFLFRTFTDLSHAQFFGIAKFDSATFARDALLDFATFTGGVSFSKVRFMKDLQLKLAQFKNDVNFEETKVIGECTFTRTIFGGKVRFNHANLGSFADFEFAEFGKSAFFLYMTFERDVSFRSASFKDYLYCNSVKFDGRASFLRAKFGTLDGEFGVDFTDCEFAKPTNFLGAVFEAKYPSFTGTRLNEATAFSDHRDHWPKGQVGDPILAKASCAAIRHNLGKQGLPEAEHFFFRREMGLAAQTGGWWERLPFRLFGLLSDFGYSIARPALWLLGMFIAVGMINHAVLQWGASLAAVGSQAAGYHPVQAFALAFSNEFPLFGLQVRWLEPAFLQGLNPWLKFFGGVQTVVALPLLFFLGLGLRTRFRMR